MKRIGQNMRRFDVKIFKLWAQIGRNATKRRKKQTKPAMTKWIGQTLERHIQCNAHKHNIKLPQIIIINKMYECWKL